MSAKPILFNTEMVRAILEGRKTVTRRVVKPQPICYGPDATFEPHDEDFFLSAEKNWLRCRVCGNDPEYSREGSNVSHHWKPPYRIGDILYVRETWFYEPFYESQDKPSDLPSGKRSWRYVYKADMADYPVNPGHWRPSIHMPREAARLFMRVTDVRVERLQDITIMGMQMEGANRKDLRSEGCSCAWKTDACMDGPCSNRDAYEYECWSLPFIELWNSTIKKADHALYGWGANPWVWVIEFERISREAAAQC